MSPKASAFISLLSWGLPSQTLLLRIATQIFLHVHIVRNANLGWGLQSQKTVLRITFQKLRHWSVRNVKRIFLKNMKFYNFEGNSQHLCKCCMAIHSWVIPGMHYCTWLEVYVLFTYPSAMSHWIFSASKSGMAVLRWIMQSGWTITDVVIWLDDTVLPNIGVILCLDDNIELII